MVFAPQSRIPRLVFAGLIATGMAFSSSGMAQASPVNSQQSAVEIAENITAKNENILPADTVISDEQIILGVVPNQTETNDDSQEIAGIAAVDTANSVVGKSSSSQSLMTILHEGTNSADFKISIPEGFKAEVVTDGSIRLRSNEANVFVPFVKAPWAVDANGKKLPTSYSISGDMITQTVETVGASFPVVADPSIQWIPMPVVALYGSQAEAIAKFTATTFVVVPGAACTLASVGGWVGKAFSVVCSLIGLSAAKAVFENIKKIWKSTYGLNRAGCYGFYLGNSSAKPANLPARDCSW